MPVDQRRPRASVLLVHVGRGQQLLRDALVGLVAVRGLLDGLLEHLVLVLVDLVAADLAGLDEAAHADGDGPLPARVAGCEQMRGPRGPRIALAGPVEREGAQRGDGHGPGAADLDALGPGRAVDAGVAQFLGQAGRPLVGEGMHVAAFDHDLQRVRLAVGDPPGQGAVHLRVGRRDAAARPEDLGDDGAVRVERVVRGLAVGGLVAGLHDEVDDAVQKPALAAARVQTDADDGEAVMHDVAAVLHGEEAPVALVQRGARLEADRGGHGEDVDGPVEGFQRAAVRQRDAWGQVGEPWHDDGQRARGLETLAPVGRVGDGRLAWHDHVLPGLAVGGADESAAQMAGVDARLSDRSAHTARLCV